MDKNGQIRIWFANIKTEDEMTEALSQLRGFLEEVLIGHNSAKVELWVHKRLVANVQQPENNIPS